VKGGSSVWSADISRAVTLRIIYRVLIIYRVFQEEMAVF
jgi:hypothetical protein